MEDRAFKRKAYKVVLLFGVVSLLADMTYEGARGIIGYALRLVSGYLADKTKLY